MQKVNALQLARAARLAESRGQIHSLTFWWTANDTVSILLHTRDNTLTCELAAPKVAITMSAELVREDEATEVLLSAKLTAYPGDTL